MPESKFDRERRVLYLLKEFINIAWIRDPHPDPFWDFGRIRIRIRIRHKKIPDPKHCLCHIVRFFLFSSNSILSW